MDNFRKRIAARCVLVAAGVTALSACSTSTTTDPPFELQLEEIGPAAQQLIDAGKYPGVVTLIAKDGETVYSDARGMANLETGAAISEETIFRFYSMTKPLTCASVMTLYDDGLIDLDDPVKKYLPEFSSMTVRTPAGVVPAKNDIKLRDLMTHTAGFGYAIAESPISQDLVDADVFAIENRLEETLEEHIKRLAKLPLVAEPGTLWHYGEAMGVLGRVVEVVSGKSFREYMQERILFPLEMVDTDFFVPADKADRLAQLYTLDANEELRSADDADLYGGNYLEKAQLEYGGAGLVGTPTDYMKFAQMLLNDGVHEGRRVVSRESVQLMTSDHLGEGFAGLAPGSGFGFCGSVTVSVDPNGAQGTIGEYGWGGWAGTRFSIDPLSSLAVLSFTQVIPGETSGASPYTNLVRSAVYD